MSIKVTATPTAAGWTCRVTVDSVSEHTVTVSSKDRERLSPNSSVEELVTRSFEFLLEREPPTSILRKFDLMEIERYFPEYAKVISSRC